MKAIIQNAYGGADILKLAEVDKPEMKEKTVLIKVRASSVNAGDYFSMRGRPWIVRLSVGLPKPKNYVLGWDVAGVVETVGKAVTRFKTGDAVFGCSSHTFAEFVASDEDVTALKPANLSYEEAAAVPSAALTALQELREIGKMRAGYDVLVNGAAGGVGTFAVQIARALGAKVTGVCSTPNVDMVKSIGAEHVIDYTKEDFAQSGQLYDLILDNVGNRSFRDCRRVLKPDGMIIPNTGHAGMGYVIRAAIRSIYMKQQGDMRVTQANHADLMLLRDLIESGKVKPVIDRIYTLEQIPEALEYAEQGHVRGKVAITIA